jgi:hypothetical protein
MRAPGGAKPITKIDHKKYDSGTGRKNMRSSTSSTAIRRLAATVSMVLAGMLMQPLTATADTADEVRAEIMTANVYSKENLKDMDGGISSQGSMQFWSSGGLIQNVPADAPASTYASFSLTPKHVEVLTLVEGKAAVAMYYSEGSYQETGSEPVAHYMTRVTEVYVKEDGKWKVRAAHYSPIAAGSGTRQTAVD